MRHVLPLLALIIITSCTTGTSRATGDINCFVYHRFGDSRHPSTNIPLDQFEAHLKHLKENNFTVLTMGEAWKKMQSDQKKLPEKTAVLTIDDGYASIKDAVPLFEEYGYRATIFVCTRYVNQKSYLSWQELKELKKKGFEIGNHSHSHEHFVNLPQGQVKETFLHDLDHSTNLFKRYLGEEPDIYAYPYGEYNQEMQAILKESDYKIGMAQKSGVIYEKSDPYTLPRFPMTGYYGKLEKFKEKAGMKAMRVESSTPSGPFPKGENPPELTLRINNPGINFSGIQCFANGSRNCSIEKKSTNPLVIKVKGERPLNSRRNLYTITAPSKDGKNWFWYTHLWIQKEYKE